MTGRNDACPCGSGRKYKHCCHHADQAARPGNMESGRAFGARSAVWQAEVLPVPVSIASEADPRPVAALVTGAGFVLHTSMEARLSGELADVAAALEKAIVAAAREAGSYPDIVEIRQAELAAELRALLLPRTIAVQVSESLPDLEAAARSFMEHMAGISTWPPVCAVETWNAWGLPHSLVAQIFRATAAFWRAAPWKIADNTQAPRVTLPSGRAWTACVLGNAGQEFGLALYSDADDLARTAASGSVEDAFSDVRGRILSLTLNPVSAVPELMPGEARRHGWGTAGTRAFPLLITINTPGGGVSRDDARDLITVLETVPAFLSKHRLALLREQRTYTASGRLDWRDPDSGAAFEYEARAAAQGLAEAERDEADADLDADLLSAMQEAVAELGPGADRDAVLRAFNVRVRVLNDAYNKQPQADLGNLSPAQLHRLLVADWSDPQGPLRLRRDLPLAQLEPSPLLFNTRMLLASAAQSDGLPATQHGNLNVATVRQMLETLRFDRELRTDLLREKRLTEKDVGPLHLARLLTGLAGLLQRRKGRFRLTHRGRAVLSEDRAGDLFSLLFQAAFRKFNLAYLAGLGPEWPELQYQIAFTMHALCIYSPDWQAADRLMNDAVLTSVLEHAPESQFLDMPASLFEHRVLRMLKNFGLVESKEGPQSNRNDRRYRKTPLFDRFISFKL